MFGFDNLARHFERRLDPGERLARKLPGAATLGSESRELLAHLHTLLRQRQNVQLRELHGLLGWQQPRTLRAVRELQQHGFVILGEDLFDPLAAPISIPGAVERQIGKLLATTS